jgi:hypothetical protein
MLRNLAIAAIAAGCYMQSAEAYVVGPAPLARANPALRSATSMRPRRGGLCTVNMGEHEVAISRMRASTCALRFPHTRESTIASKVVMVMRPSHVCGPVVESVDRPGHAVRTQNSRTWSRAASLAPACTGANARKFDVCPL